MRKTQKAPSESVETIKLSNWLLQHGYMYSKIPSETFTKSWNTKRKNKMEGVHKGVPDMLIILKRQALLFVELKKEKGARGGMNGSKISPEQARWIEALSKIDNVDACICHGAEEAIRLITLLETNYYD